MTALELRGITWNHSRALPPLVAASQRYEELHPQIRIQWDRRTLDEFGHASLADLAQRYDLLIIDHPMLGEVHRDGILLDLKARLQPENFTAVQSDALGPCFESYCYEDNLYALPIDAAAPAASYRPDLLERAGRLPPATWDELICLARAGIVCMPAFPADLFLNFLGMCASRNGMIGSHDQLFDRAIATRCLEELCELASHMPEAIYSMNPIHIYETMSSHDEFAYCPFAYTYSNYSRPGFARHTLLFANPVSLREGIPLRTILGGTGIAISAQCKHSDDATEFCAYVAGSDCQTRLYGICGGQPASKTSWRDPLLNSVSNSFFERTSSSIEAAIVRPRYAGYIALQATAGETIAAHFHGELSMAHAVDQIEDLYRRSLSAGPHEKELTL
ncbi:MAG TPA: extracellular solute-binding protein [Acidobacteriaceae bacterium]|nr:extracellular solute-binding protein [Acidobacteriaceae bacterium]